MRPERRERTHLELEIADLRPKLDWGWGTHKRMSEQINKQMKKQTNKRMNEQTKKQTMDKQNSTCVLQDFVPPPPPLPKNHL